MWDGPHATGPFEGAFTGLGAVGQHITELPKLDLVVAHKTRPGGQSVSHTQFVEVLELLLRARCGPETAMIGSPSAVARRKTPAVAPCQGS